MMSSEEISTKRSEDVKAGDLTRPRQAMLDAELVSDQNSSAKNISELSSPADGSTEPSNPASLSKRALKKLKRKAERKESTTKKKKRKEDICSEDILKETSYYYQNGLRKVYPYYYTFSTYVKGRWINQSILDVFCKEFKHFADSEFEKKIKDGSVLVNGQAVGVDYVLKNHDFLCNESHRHEVPVTAEPIQILHDDSEMLVINKPSSLPCHPCGSFRHNSAIFILYRDHGYQNLKFVHRLDRLTSGVMLLAKTLEKARTLTQQVAQRKVLKEYICKVQGDFPDGLVECKEPLDIMSFKLGVQKVSPDGKEAKTTFQKVSFKDGASIVKCWPHTGRTHQIRVHLQYLGYPIVNDPLYNTHVWGPKRGKGGDFGNTDEELIRLLLKNHDKAKFVYGWTDDTADIPDASDPKATDPTRINNTQDNPSSPVTDTSKPNIVNVTQEPVQESNDDLVKDNRVTCKSLPNTTPGGDSETVGSVTMVPDGSSKKGDTTLNLPVLDPSKMVVDPNCVDCKRQFKDPEPEELVMYLHALRYKGPDWDYSSPWPTWANDDS